MWSGWRPRARDPDVAAAAEGDRWAPEPKKATRRADVTRDKGLVWFGVIILTLEENFPRMKD